VAKGIQQTAIHNREIIKKYCISILLFYNIHYIRLLITIIDISPQNITMEQLPFYKKIKELLTC
jgi:hypothetical protein